MFFSYRIWFWSDVCLPLALFFVFEFCFGLKSKTKFLVLQAILGGFESIYKAKEEKRKKAGLQVLDENPLEIVQNMKASAPPTSASDILEIAQGPRRRPRRVWF